MKNMRNFTIKFLLFALFPTALFGMQHQHPLSVHGIAAAFHSNPQAPIVIMCSNGSIALWDTVENSLTTLFIDSLQKKLKEKKIHSINYTNDNNTIEITAYTPSGKSLYTPVNAIPTADNLDSVNAKKLILNIHNKKFTTENREQLIQNKRSHTTSRNTTLDIIATPNSITGYVNNKQLTNNIINTITSYTLLLSDTDAPIVAAGFKDQTHIHSLDQYNAFQKIPHPQKYSTAVACSPDCTKFLLCTHDGFVELYLLEDSKFKFKKKTNVIPGLSQKQPIELLTERLTYLLRSNSEQESQLTNLTQLITAIQTTLNKPTIYTVIKEILFNPLCALKVLCRKTSFTTKTIATLAGLSALWFCYTKYLTSRA